VTRDEAKGAFMQECPVMMNGIRYKRVSALIYRKKSDGSGLYVQVELQDRTSRSVVIATPERISFCREDKPHEI